MKLGKSKINDNIQCGQRSRETGILISNRTEHWELKLLENHLTLNIESHENVYNVWRSNLSSEIYHKVFKVFSTKP